MEITAIFLDSITCEIIFLLQSTWNRIAVVIDDERTCLLVRKRQIRIEDYEKFQFVLSLLFTDKQITLDSVLFLKLFYNLIPQQSCKRLKRDMLRDESISNIGI